MGASLNQQNSGSNNVGKKPDPAPSQAQEKETLNSLDVVPDEIPVMAQPDNAIHYETTDEKSESDNLLLYVGFGLFAVISVGIITFFWLRRRHSSLPTLGRKTVNDAQNRV